MSRRASGLRAWLLQRLTAVYMLFFLVFFLGCLSSQLPLSYEQWREWFSSPVIFISFSLFFTSLLIHAWVGARDVIIDYINPTGIRLLMLSAVGFSLIAMAVWVLAALIGVISG